MRRPTQIFTTNQKTILYASRSNHSASYNTMESLPEGSVLSVVTNEPSGDYLPVYNSYSNLIGYVDTKTGTLNDEPTLFIPDLYWKDLDEPNHRGDQVRLDKLWGDARYLGAVLKATEGTALSAAEIDWFKYNWDLLLRLGGADYGSFWFRGCYHFLDLSAHHASGGEQADYYIETVHQAGGLLGGDLPPILDVEFNKHQPNPAVEDVVKTASEWAERVRKKLKRKTVLYRSVTDSGPKTKSYMKCSYLWAKRYNSRLNTENPDWSTKSVGWPSSAMWQYTNGEYAHVPTGYPTHAPGIGPIYQSVFQYGKGRRSDVLAWIEDSKLE